MRIMENRDAAYLVDCECPRGGSFLVRRLSLTVECPNCGRVEPMAELVTAWVDANHRSPPLEAAD